MYIDDFKLLFGPMDPSDSTAAEELMLVIEQDDYPRRSFNPPTTATPVVAGFDPDSEVVLELGGPSDDDPIIVCRGIPASSALFIATLPEIYLELVHEGEPVAEYTLKVLPVRSTEPAG
jgi:hypothetical protein